MKAAAALQNQMKMKEYENKKGDKQVTYHLKHSSHYTFIQQSRKSVSYNSVDNMKNYETEIIDLRKKSLGQMGPHLVPGDLASVPFPFLTKLRLSPEPLSGCTNSKQEGRIKDSILCNSKFL